MADTDSALKVVVTGASGPVADAVLPRLRGMPWSVTPVQRGEDVANAIRRADVVAVLDAATSSSKDYRLAIDAVIDAGDRTNPCSVVTVTPLPPAVHEREGFIAAAEKAERRLSDAGHRTTVIRTTLVVGEPDDPGPHDRVLVDGRGPLLIPGDGTAKVRPILLDDLALVVRDAIEAAHRPQSGDGTAAASLDAPGESAPPAVVAGEGPIELSVDKVLKTLRPGGTVWHMRSPAAPLRFAAGFAAAALPIALVRLSEAAVSEAAAVAAGITVSLAVVTALKLGATGRVIPAKDLLVGDAQQPGPDALRNIEEVWNAEAHERRRKRRESARRARWYAVHRAWPWIMAFLLLAGFGAFAVGLHDIVFASAVSAKLAAAMMLGGGLTMMFGGGVLATRWRARYQFAFLGTLVALMTTLSVVASAALNGDPPVWLPFPALYVGGAAILSASVLWQKGGLGVLNFMRTKGIKALGSVLLGGTLAALVPLISPSMSAPSTANPTISADVSLTAAPMTHIAGEGATGRIPVQVTISFRNVAKGPVVVLAAAYTLYATRAGSRPPRSLPGHRGLLPVSGRAANFSRSVTRVVVEHGALTGAGVAVQAGESTTRRLTAFVPPTFDVATARVDVALSRDRSDGQRPYRQIHWYEQGVPVVDTVSRIRDDLWLHRLTRSPRYVHVQEAGGYAVPCPPHNPPFPALTTGVHVYVSRYNDVIPSRWCNSPGQLERYYGLTYATAMADVFLRARPS